MPRNSQPVKLGDDLLQQFEPLGSEVFAYVENGGKEMVSRLDPRTGVRVGQPVDLVVDMGKMHIFDRETEKALV